MKVDRDIRVLCRHPSPSDATSFYRAVGPLKRLERQLDMRVRFEFMDVSPTKRVTWADFENADLYFSQRPYTENDIKLVNYAHLQGIPVWTDFDDDVFSVPAWNPAHKNYSDERTQKCVAECIASSDIVTVSTPYLRERLLELNPNITVVPNAYPTHSLGRYRKPDRGVLWQKKLAVWRGSKTHDDDLMQFTQQLGSAVQNHLDWTYCFFGSPFWLTIEYLKKAAANNPKSILLPGMIETYEYLYAAWAMKPALFFVPLSPDVFNMSKSNIAWMEAAHTGAAAIVPDWAEWKVPGALNYRDPKHFGELMEAAARGEIDLHKQANESYAYMREMLDLDKVNQKRFEVMKWCIEECVPKEPHITRMDD